jgi:hypothetical protein
MGKGEGDELGGLDRAEVSADYVCGGVLSCCRCQCQVHSFEVEIRSVPYSMAYIPVLVPMSKTFRGFSTGARWSFPSNIRRNR